MEIKNAKITNSRLYIEDHGILTFDISLNLGGAYCTVGGYALDKTFTEFDKFGNKIGNIRKASPAGLECMRKIMETVGVEAWEDLKGKYIRYEDNGWGSTITKIGNIMEDKWIDLSEFFKEYDYEYWYKKFCNKE